MDEPQMKKLRWVLVAVGLLASGFCFFDAYRPPPAKESLEVVKAVPVNWTLTIEKERKDSDADYSFEIEFADDAWVYHGRQARLNPVRKAVDTAIDEKTEIELLVSSDWTRLPGAFKIWEVRAGGQVIVSYDANAALGGQGEWGMIGGIALAVMAVVLVFVKLPQ